MARTFLEPVAAGQTLGSVTLSVDGKTLRTKNAKGKMPNQLASGLAPITPSFFLFFPGALRTLGPPQTPLGTK